MKKLPGDFLTVSREADYVFRGDETIIMVSGGKVLTVTTRLSKESSAVVLTERTGQDQIENVLFEGSASAAMQAFLDLRSLIGKRPRKSLLATIQSLSVSAAALAIAVSLSLFVIETRQGPTTLPSIEHASPTLGPADEMDMAPEVGPTGTHDQSTLSPDVPELRVLQKPDFLASANPMDTRTPAPVAESAGRKASIADTVAAIGLPVGNPNDGKPADKLGPGSPGNNPGNTSTSEISTLSPAKKESASMPTDRKKSTSSAAATTPAKPTTTTPAEVGASDPAISDNAQAAIKKLIGDGMTEDQIRKLLVDLQSLKAGSADGITPEMLQALPEEVAALLADQGMELDGPGGGTMNILPSEVVDRFRGKDGVATIPENHSWYARSGGPVSIPLPGGGDIKKPDDLKDFGLQP